jgi:hypothetical protein
MTLKEDPQTLHTQGAENLLSFLQSLNPIEIISFKGTLTPQRDNIATLRFGPLLVRNERGVMYVEMETGNIKFNLSDSKGRCMLVDADTIASVKPGLDCLTAQFVWENSLQQITLSF